MDRTDTLRRMVDALYAIAGWDDFPTGNRYHDPIRSCWWFEQVIGERAFLYSVGQIKYSVDAKIIRVSKAHLLRAVEWSAWVVDEGDDWKLALFDTHDLSGDVDQFERDAVLLILAKPP